MTLKGFFCSENGVKLPLSLYRSLAYLNMHWKVIETSVVSQLVLSYVLWDFSVRKREGKLHFLSQTWLQVFNFPLCKFFSFLGKTTFAFSQNRLVGFTFHLKLTFCFLFALLFYTESLLSSLCWQNSQRLF